MLELQRATGETEIVDGELIIEERQQYTLLHSSATAMHLAERELSRNERGWVVDVGFWAGASTLTLSLPDTVATVPVRIVPDANKFDSDTWLSMLQEIELWMAGLSVGLAGGRSGHVGEDGIPLPLLTESLLPLVPALVQALNAVIRSPRVKTSDTLQRIELNRVRKVSPELTRWLGRNPSPLSEDTGSDDAGPARATFLPLHQSQESLDHAANRYLAWLLARVARRFNECAAAWQSYTVGPEDYAEWAAARARLCKDAAVRVRETLRRSFFVDIVPQPAADAALLVIADDYARVHRLSRLILSPHFNPTVAHERPAPLRQTFDLYELWSFIEVQRQLSWLWPEAQWESKGLTKLLDQSSNGGGAQYSAHFSSGRKIAIDFNPTFASYWARQNRPRWSLSKERRPDIVVTVSGGDGPPRWLFLDAKYRVSRERLGEAFESVHLYRDSLRDDSHGGSCVAGALLCPRSRADTSPWFASAFRDEHRCGVFELNPSRKQDDLARWVASTLGI